MAEPLLSKRWKLPNGQYKFSVTVGSKRYDFTCYEDQFRKQLNYMIDGGKGIKPEIAKKIEERQDPQAALRRKAIMERPHLQYDPEFYYGRIEDYREPGDEEVFKKPSGLTIAERNRLTKLYKKYP